MVILMFSLNLRQQCHVEENSTNEIIAQTQETISLVRFCSPIPVLSYSPHHGTAL